MLKFQRHFSCTFLCQQYCGVRACFCSHDALHMLNRAGFQLPFQVCDLNVYRLCDRKLEQFGKVLTLGVLAAIIQVWVAIHNPGLDSVAAVLEV